MNPSLALIAFAVVATLAGLLYVQHDRLGDALAERDAAIEQRDSAQQAIAELAVENAIASRRQAVVSSGREAVIAAPAEADGPVADVLWQALETVDAIGGAE